MPVSIYSFEGARQILAGKQGRTVKTLDAALGIAILAAGPAYLATHAAAFVAVWGWIDQKNELTRLIDRLIAEGKKRLGKSIGHPRHEILAATHAALVVGAFFSGLKAVLGDRYEKLGLTEQDKLRLVEDDQDGRKAVHRHTEIVEGLLQLDIPLPWAACGFEENLKINIEPFYATIAVGCLEFFASFASWKRPEGVRQSDLLLKAIVKQARAQYRDDYMRLASEVKEFEIWALLGEIRASDRVVRRAGDALRRLEELLGNLGLAEDARRKKSRGAIDAINRAVLESPLSPLGEIDRIGNVVIPTVRAGYVDPDYRWALIGGDSRPADDHWWDTRERLRNLDAFLAAYFASPRSGERPLVVLGHPGSGKSLFTKVCAARLSGNGSFAAVRIALRDVDHPAAPIYRQIEQALSDGTNGVASWADLCADAGPAMRVVFIDGLDELMQATGSAESHYLQAIVEFQRVEALTRGPVAVVVTSRTIVADLASIPFDSVVVKIEDFDPEQVAGWIARWEAANKAAIGRGLVKSVPTDLVERYDELVKQPLLLLLLALFVATADAVALKTVRASRAIYGRLLTEFVRRELVKDEAPLLDDEETALAAELWNLSIAAMGMFNRGRHYISEADLLGDLNVFPAPSARPNRALDVRVPLDPARKLIGRFFFVRTAQALSVPRQRSYEFLHATFAEYLIGLRVVSELTELDSAFRAPSSQQWDDDRLFAFASHQVLNSGGATVLSFARQIYEEHPANGRADICRVLRVLLGNHPRRWGPGRFSAYVASDSTYVRRSATYSANLALLLVTMSDEPVRLHHLFADDVDPLVVWRFFVDLWRMGLDDVGWRSLLSGIDVAVDSTGIVITAGRGETDGIAEAWAHRLALRLDDAIAAVAGWRDMRPELPLPSWYLRLTSLVRSSIAVDPSKTIEWIRREMPLTHYISDAVLLRLAGRDVPAAWW